MTEIRTFSQGPSTLSLESPPTTDYDYSDLNLLLDTPTLDLETPPLRPTEKERKTRVTSPGLEIHTYVQAVILPTPPFLRGQRFVV